MHYSPHSIAVFTHDAAPAARDPTPSAGRPLISMLDSFLSSQQHSSRPDDAGAATASAGWGPDAGHTRVEIAPEELALVTQFPLCPVVAHAKHGGEPVLVWPELELPWINNVGGDEAPSDAASSAPSSSSDDSAGMEIDWALLDDGHGSAAAGSGPSAGRHPFGFGAPAAAAAGLSTSAPTAAMAPPRPGARRRTTSGGATDKAAAPRSATHPHLCSWPGCGKRYTKRSRLVAHERAHRGEKPFKCGEPGCGWGFSRADELARHSRSHSGFKPFKCLHCSKGFGRSDHLKKHMKIHA